MRQSRDSLTPGSGAAAAGGARAAAAAGSSVGNCADGDAKAERHGGRLQVRPLLCPSLALFSCPCAHLPPFPSATRPSSVPTAFSHQLAAFSKLKMRCFRSATVCCTKAFRPRTWSSPVSTTAWGKRLHAAHYSHVGGLCGRVGQRVCFRILPRLFRTLNINTHNLTARIRNYDAQLKQVRGFGF